MKSIMVPLHHGMFQVFQEGSQVVGRVHLDLQVATVVVDRPIWRTSLILMRNISPQKMRDHKCLVLPLSAKVEILATFNIQSTVTFL